jgi:hypothetical protein
MAGMDERGRLIATVEYAIWRAPVRAARHKLEPTDRTLLARAIVDHLYLSNWTIKPGVAPPLRPNTVFSAPGDGHE